MPEENAVTEESRSLSKAETVRHLVLERAPILLIITLATSALVILLFYSVLGPVLAVACGIGLFVSIWIDIYFIDVPRWQDRLFLCGACDHIRDTRSERRSSNVHCMSCRGSR